jgi:RHS repeat-associated protein
LVETSGSGGVVQYAYDAEGNRTSRTTAAGKTVFVVDPNMPYAQVLEEHGPAGAKLYAYGNDMLNMQGPDGTHWFDYDGLGSVRALTDASGTLTDTYTYEAFGSVAHRTGTTANDFRFTGEQYDEALEMYYLRARYYEPGTGRFGARDTWDGQQENPQSLNGFTYSFNNPSNLIDPSGLKPNVDWKTIVEILNIPVWVIGTFVHYEIFDWFYDNVDPSAICNCQIFKDFGINAKPDIVSVVMDNTALEIYEIKPDSIGGKNGSKQLKEGIQFIENHGFMDIKMAIPGMRCSGEIKRAKRLMWLVDITFWQPEPGLVYYQLKPSDLGLLLTSSVLVSLARKISMITFNSMRFLLEGQLPLAGQLAARGVW